ncbi:MAG: efflux RND transporter permease subunit [Candidatus Hydrogenedentota bacterium]
MTNEPENTILGRVVHFCIHRKVVVLLLTLACIGWGILVAPFDWDFASLPRDPIPVDAIPDIGENQQIVFTEWTGRSPQDVEDQITYPLTVSLLGMPGVKSIRSFSYLGFSSIYIIFNEDIEFYWSRSRVLEKLSSLPVGTIPDSVQPTLGPDATGLGQVFWYTLEGHDADGNATGGWDLNELRSVQDWQIRYALQSVEGVAEVASVGGFVQEYQVDVDPDAMRAYDVTLKQVFDAVRDSNVDVGARTIEMNGVEYVIRGLGFLRDVSDIEQSVITSHENTPIYIKNVAHVSLGPAMRRGALDKGGAEAVGGVVVVRYGENPLATIDRVKEKIREIEGGLPSKILANGVESRVTIVPFYDRSNLIHETLGTLSTALTQEILVTIIVVLVMVFHLRSSILISGLLPLAVLMSFIAMHTFGVDANVVALSGIAIAIGTMVDMGVVVCENILKHLDTMEEDEPTSKVILRATVEVGSAVLTAVMTTIVSFLPVFTMEAAEGKLFKPLAFTKTFAILASVIVALMIIPPVAHLMFARRSRLERLRVIGNIALVLLGIVLALKLSLWAGMLVTVVGLYRLAETYLPPIVRSSSRYVLTSTIALLVAVVLAREWAPLGPEQGWLNGVFVIGLIGGILTIAYIIQWVYVPVLRFCLANKALFLSIPSVLVLFGLNIWLGFPTVFGVVPGAMRTVGLDDTLVTQSRPWEVGAKAFPGLGKEFMPPLDEGSYLYMPTTMPHASIGTSMDMLQKQDMAIRSIPEVESVVGKIGRAETPLDPAPIAMVETVINYVSEYKTDDSGNRLRYRYDKTSDTYSRDENGELIEDPKGRLFRQWRPHIKKADDIWAEIIKVAQVPGSTSAPKLQPIAARLVMLQSGMRAPMGVKVFGPDLESIESVGLQIEKFLKQLPQVNPDTVIADRVVGKPYMEIHIDREAIARYGLTIRAVQDVIEVAVGGRHITTTVEGRERYTVRVRYMRELRDQLESLERVLVSTNDGVNIPLGQLARIEYRRGPQAIKSEDTFLVSYVIFDKKSEFDEVNTVLSAKQFLEDKILSKELILPDGVSYAFSGNYENQVRSEQRLLIVLPLALVIIFIILYLQFKAISTSLLIFTSIFVAWSGGFQMMWLYGQDWFLNVDVLGTNLRDLFQVHPLNLSVATWVGFLALFGIASDDGVLIATYLKQRFSSDKPESVESIREATIDAAKRRIRPCLMTTATTILALIPILTSTGRGSDIMVPMAIPSFGGMTVVTVTIFVVPVLFCAIEEFKLKALKT